MLNQAWPDGARRWPSPSSRRRPAATAATAAADGGKVKLTVATFGEFGYKELYKEYKKANPNIEIVERVTKAEDHHKNLAAHLATNKGAADIEAIEEGWIGQFKAAAGQVPQPAGPRRQRHQGRSGRSGSGSCRRPRTARADRPRHRRRRPGDVLPHATCSRRRACPPTAIEVSALWPTWEDYIATGKRFKAAKVPGVGVLRRPDRHVPRGPRPGRRSASTTPTTRSSWRPTRPCEACVRQDRRGAERGPVGEDRRVVAGLERRLPEGLLRHHRLPVAG